MRGVALAVWMAWFAIAGCSSDDESAEAGGAAGSGGAATGGAATGGGGAGGHGVGGSDVGGGGGAEPWQPVETDWCTGAWLGLDEGTCFYAPGQPTTPSALLVFLHGMMPPDAAPTTMQSMVQQAADDHGFVALFPRGQAGLCSWDPSVEDWWCWPTSRENVDTHAAEIIAGWEQAESLLASILQVQFDDRYLLGFSNGGYFASYVGLEDLWTSAGAGLVAAGRSFVDEALLSDWRPPFYIAVGDLDVASVQQSAENLAWVLYLNDWPYDYVLHAGRGHELGQDDFDAAWTLWTGL